MARDAPVGGGRNAMLSWPHRRTHGNPRQDTVEYGRGHRKKLSKSRLTSGEKLSVTNTDDIGRVR